MPELSPINFNIVCATLGRVYLYLWAGVLLVQGEILPVRSLSVTLALFNLEESLGVLANIAQ